MRPFKSIEKEHEALKKQNQRIIDELSRLSIVNTGLKKKIHSLTLSRLHLHNEMVDNATQTDFDVDNNVEVKEAPKFVPETVTKVVTPDKVSFNPLIQQTMTFDNSLTFSADELLDFDNYVRNSDVHDRTPLKAKQRSPRHNVKSPKLMLTTKHVKSPVKRRSIPAEISDRIVKALFPMAGRSPLTSPDITQPGSMPTLSPVVLAQDRVQRRVRKPVSYKEPSLRVKVRKGFKFIKFQDVVEETEQDLLNSTSSDVESEVINEHNDHCV